jgi:Uncharacterised protein family (UPF0175)
MLWTSRGKSPGRTVDHFRPVQEVGSPCRLPTGRGLTVAADIMQVTVKMPEQVARQWGEIPDAVGRHVMEDAAIEGYRAGRLSHRQVGEMLGLDYWQTEVFLKERGEE